MKKRFKEEAIKCSHAADKFCRMQTEKWPLDFARIVNFFKINLFIYSFIYLFWLHWVFVAARGLSLVAAIGAYSSLRCMDFSLRWLILLWSTGSRCVGFSSCGMQAQ